ncbi:16522_t:CDS:2 [Entrophospora sp. SA101]|nr:16522_t:CDS:2 [Entrophospora sp. SA101]
MKQFIIFTILLVLITQLTTASVIPASSISVEKRAINNGFELCQENTPITIADFSYSPDPIKIGQDLTMNLAGKSTVGISDGTTVNIVATVFGVTVLEKTEDFCSNVVKYTPTLTCPIAAGDFDFTITQAIPNDNKLSSMPSIFTRVKDNYSTGEYNNNDVIDNYSTGKYNNNGVVNNYSTGKYNNNDAGFEEASIQFTKKSPNLIKETSIKKPLDRGDSVKHLQTLMQPNSNSKSTFNKISGNESNFAAKKPVTAFEIFQAWMINEDGNLTEARGQFGITFTIAKSSALVLHVDAAFILFPVCRNLISLVRATPLNNVIPFDKNIQFHKLIGYSIVFFTIVHTVAHWVNFYRLAIVVSQGGVVDFLILNFATGPGATGYVMLICLLIMVVTSSKKARNRNFNTFWYFHHLFIPFFGVWAFHGAFCMIKPDRPPFCDDIASFWKYWIASGLVYIGERILREIRSRRKTFISKVIMHPSKVVEIQMRKDGIVSKAGQYVFICCPEISLWEWHPFTLTSAPEEDYISIHVRVLGDFTGKLLTKLGCDYKEEAKLREKNKDRLKSIYDGVDISLDNPGLQKVLPRIMVDGPFGSASEDAFEWFQSLLMAIEEQDIDQFIEIHTYLTGQLRKSEIGNIYTNDDGTLKDTITGLKSPTHFGRPNWDKILSNMRTKYPETDVGVFFCGPKALDKVLHNKCNLWSDVAGSGTSICEIPLLY